MDHDWPEDVEKVQATCGKYQSFPALNIKYDAFSGDVL
jgi:hypothetical protein